MMETGLPQLLEGLSISLESRKTEQMKYGGRLACGFPAGPDCPHIALPVVISLVLWGLMQVLFALLIRKTNQQTTLGKV